MSRKTVMKFSIETFGFVMNCFYFFRLQSMCRVKFDIYGEALTIFLNVMNIGNNIIYPIMDLMR